MKHILSLTALVIALFSPSLVQSHNQALAQQKHRPHFRTSDNDNNTLLISVNHEEDVLDRDESQETTGQTTDQTTHNDADIDTLDTEFSSHVDNLNDFNQEITVDEAMYYFIALIESILNNPDLANKEAMHAYLTEHLTKLVKGQKFLFSVSLTAQKKSAPQEGPLDEESTIVISNFADIACNFFNIVKDPNNPENVATGLKGMLGGLVNIAVFATKKSKCCDDNLNNLQLHIQQEAL